MSTVLSALALIGVIVLFALHFAKPAQTDAQKSTITIGDSTKSRIAYVNIDSLLTYYRFYDAISKDFRDKRIKQEKQLQTRSRKLEEEVGNAQKRAQAGLMSQNEIQKTQQDLAYKEQELMAYQRSLQEGLYAEEQNLNRQLNEKVIDYLKSYNKDDRFDLIFSYGSGSPIMLATDALDITQAILKGLNDEWDASQKEAGK